METKTVLLDSSIIIEYFRKENKSKSILYKLSERYHFCISTITIFEIKMGLKTKSQWNDYKIHTKNIEIIPVDETCINKAITKYHDLNEQNNLIELSDLLIAGVPVRVIPVPGMTGNRLEFQYSLDRILVYDKIHHF